ncbi:MAG: hypothetical protein WD873_03550 [Candidatus Hydrogenedentales bacterium]
MAVKFKRESVTEADGDRLARTYVPRFLPANPKQRLIVIYLGLLAATLMLLAAHVLGVFQSPQDNPLMEGTVSITGKRTVLRDDGGLLHIVEVTATVPASDGAPQEVTAPAAIDEAAWARIEVGDELQARYRWDVQTKVLTVLSLDEVPQ